METSIGCAPLDELPGPLRGHVERVTATVDGTAQDIEGWVLDESAPEQPVELAVSAEGTLPVRLPDRTSTGRHWRADGAASPCGFPEMDG